MSSHSPGTCDGLLPAEVAEAIRDKEFPIFLTRYGASIWPVADPSVGPPTIVLSVPKSGTYFTEALYRRMGYSPVYVHGMTTFCNDWRFEIAGARNRKVAGIKSIPITILSQLVLPGQIIVSHAGYNRDIEAALHRFKKVYLYRNLREIFVSHTRADSTEEIPQGHLASHVADFCRRSGAGLKHVIETAAEWRNQKSVLAVDFADLTSTEASRREAVAERFAMFMDWPTAAVLEALCAIPDEDTPTRYDNTRSTVRGSWNDQCEAWFQEHMTGVRVAPDNARS